MIAFTQHLKATVSQMILEGARIDQITGATGLSVGQVRGYSHRTGYRIKRLYHARGTASVKGPNGKRVALAKVPKPSPYPPVRKREKRTTKPVLLDDLKIGLCRWMLDERFYCGKIAIIRNGRQQSWCRHHYSKVFRLGT